MAIKIVKNGLTIYIPEATEIVKKIEQTIETNKCGIITEALKQNGGILVFDTKKDFPSNLENTQAQANIIYKAQDTNKLFQWNGADYEEITSNAIGDTGNTNFDMIYGGDAIKSKEL